jgi:hypothetical protein
MMRAAYLWRSSDCLLFIVVAVVAVTCTVSEEIQNTTSSFSYAWQSDDDVADELGRADRFDDKLFQPDLQLTVELVRSNGYGICVARPPDCAAQTRVRTRAPPTGAIK